MQGLDLVSDNYVSGKQRTCASRYLTGAIICANASMFRACPILQWTGSTQRTPTISVSSVCQEPVFIYRYDVNYNCTVLRYMNFRYGWHIKIPQTLAYSKINSRIYAKKVQSTFAEMLNIHWISHQYSNFFSMQANLNWSWNLTKFIKLPWHITIMQNSTQLQFFKCRFIKAPCIIAPFLCLSIHIEALHNVHISFTV